MKLNGQNLRWFAGHLSIFNDRYDDDPSQHTQLIVWVTLALKATSLNKLNLKISTSEDFTFSRFLLRFNISKDLL